MSSYTFYSYVPLARTEPTAVYRFSEDENESPEYYRVGVGWVKDDDLFLLLAKGEISDSDQIDAAQAEEIIHNMENI